MNLPKDPVILLSVVNTMLRDKYSSLSALCDDTGADIGEISASLAAIGYEYSEEHNSFI